jgi:hypothetical protein
VAHNSKRFVREGIVSPRSGTLADAMEATLIAISATTPDA